MTPTLNDSCWQEKKPVKLIGNDLFLQVANNGVVMINFYSCFIVAGCDETNPGDIQDVVSKWLE